MLYSHHCLHVVYRGGAGVTNGGWIRGTVGVAGEVMGVFVYALRMT